MVGRGGETGRCTALLYFSVCTFEVLRETHLGLDLVVMPVAEGGLSVPDPPPFLQDRLFSSLPRTTFRYPIPPSSQCNIPQYLDQHHACKSTFSLFFFRSTSLHKNSTFSNSHCPPNLTAINHPPLLPFKPFSSPFLYQPPYPPH